MTTIIGRHPLAPLFAASSSELVLANVTSATPVAVATPDGCIGFLISNRDGGEVTIGLTDVALRGQMYPAGEAAWILFGRGVPGSSTATLTITGTPAANNNDTIGSVAYIWRPDIPLLTLNPAQGQVLISSSGNNTDRAARLTRAINGTDVDLVDTQRNTADFVNRRHPQVRATSAAGVVTIFHRIHPGAPGSDSVSLTETGTATTWSSGTLAAPSLWVTTDNGAGDDVTVTRFFA